MRGVPDQAVRSAAEPARRGQTAIGSKEQPVVCHRVAGEADLVLRARDQQRRFGQEPGHIARPTRTGRKPPTRQSADRESPTDLSAVGNPMHPDREETIAPLRGNDQEAHAQDGCVSLGVKRWPTIWPVLTPKMSVRSMQYGCESTLGSPLSSTSTNEYAARRFAANARSGRPNWSCAIRSDARTVDGAGG